MNRSEMTQSAALTYGHGAETLFHAPASALTLFINYKQFFIKLQAENTQPTSTNRSIHTYTAIMLTCLSPPHHRLHQQFEDIIRLPKHLLAKARDMRKCNVTTWRHRKHNTPVRFLPCYNMTTSETQQFYEPFSIFEKITLKTKKFCETSFKMESWMQSSRPRAHMSCDVPSPSV